MSEIMKNKINDEKIELAKRAIARADLTLEDIAITLDLPVELVRALSNPVDPETTEEFFLTPSTRLTEEQVRQLADAESRPIVFDEDCPESTPEQLERFRRYGQERNKRRAEMERAIRADSRNRERSPRYKIIRNAARCNHCGDVIESTYRHNFVTCSCGRVSVDGGFDYLRRCGDPSDYTDLSETEGGE